MASKLPAVPESLSSAEDLTTQLARPSVTWNLGLSTASADAAQASTSSGTNPASAFFRRSRVASRPEVNVGARPQICFLRPRTTQPLVFFRWGPRAQRGCQTPAPLGEPELSLTPAPGTPALAPRKPRAPQSPALS